MFKSYNEADLFIVDGDRYRCEQNLDVDINSGMVKKLGMKQKYSLVKASERELVSIVVELEPSITSRVTSVKQNSDDLPLFQEKGYVVQTTLGGNPLIANAANVTRTPVHKALEGNSDEDLSSKLAIGESIPPCGRWFIPIHRASLQTYFARGLIYPVNCEERQNAKKNRERDILSRYPDSLVIFEGIPSVLPEDNILIEIVLTGTEREDDSVFTLDVPLPLSRVNGLYFGQSAEKIDEICTGMSMYRDSLIPRSICHSLSELGDLPKVLSPLAIVDESSSTASRSRAKYMSNIARYDRYLGMFAFMRTAGVYFTKSCKIYKQLPDFYRRLCSLLIDGIALENDLGQNDNMRSIANAMLSMEAGKSPLVEQVVDQILEGQPAEHSQLHKLAQSEYGRLKYTKDNPLGKPLNLFFQEGDYRTAAQTLADSTEWLPFLMSIVLAKFNKPDSDDVTNVKDWIEEDFKNPETAAVLLAMLGLYYGYLRLPAWEDIPELSPNLDEKINSRQFIKFGTESPMDRLIVEAIYQRAFFDKIPTLEILASSLNMKLPSSSSHDHKIQSDTLIDESVIFLGERIARYRISARKEQLEAKRHKVNEKIKAKYPEVLTVGNCILLHFFANCWPKLGVYPEIGPYHRRDILKQVASLDDSGLDEMLAYISFEKKLAETRKQTQRRVKENAGSISNI
jgi:hypothetical protein